jgi:hypothetical protein
MRKLPAVEDARALMTEALEWSLWRWLADKGRVRAAADEAVAALSACEENVKAAWPDELKQAYESLMAQQSGRRRKTKPVLEALDPAMLEAARRAKEAFDVAEQVRLEAEDTFAQAERRLSTSMAKEGAQKALESWDLREKAIRTAETVGRKRK